MSKSVVLVIVLLSRAAFADGDDEVKSRDTALALSIGGSIASVGLFVAGAAGLETNHPQLGWAAVAGSLVTPSLGEWYGGKYLTIGLALRVAGAATAGYGIAASFCNDSSCSSDFGHAMIALGVLTAAGGIGYDIATARGTVDTYNANHRRVVMTPTLLNPPSGPVMGVGLGGSF